MNETQQKNLADRVVGMVREGKWKTLNNGRDRSVYKWLCDNLSKREHNLARNMVDQELGNDVPLDVKIAMKRVASKVVEIVQRDNGDVGIVHAVHSDSAEVVFSNEFNVGNYRPELVALEQLTHIGTRLVEKDIGDIVVRKQKANSPKYEIVAIGLSKFDKSVSLALKDTTTGQIIVDVEDGYALDNNKFVEGARVINILYGYTGTVIHAANGSVKFFIDSDKPEELATTVRNEQLRVISDGTKVTFESVFDKLSPFNEQEPDPKDVRRHLDSLVYTKTHSLPFGTILRLDEANASENFYKKYMRYLYSKATRNGEGVGAYDVVCQSLKGEVIQISSDRLNIVLGDSLAQIQPMFDQLPMPEGFDQQRESAFHVGQPVKVKSSQNISSQYRGLHGVIEAINGDGTVTVSVSSKDDFKAFTVPEKNISEDKESPQLVGMKAVQSTMAQDSSKGSPMYEVLSYHRGGVYKTRDEEGKENWENVENLIAITPKMQAEIDAQKTYKIGDVYYYATKKTDRYDSDSGYSMVQVVGYRYKSDKKNGTVSVLPMIKEFGSDRFEPFPAAPNSKLIDAGSLAKSDQVFVRREESGKVVDTALLLQGSKDISEAMGKIGNGAVVELPIKDVLESIGGAAALKGKIIGDHEVVALDGKHTAENAYISNVTLREENNAVEIMLNSLSGKGSSRSMLIGAPSLISLSSSVSPMSDFMSGKKIDIPNIADQFKIEDKKTQFQVDEKGNIPFVSLITELTRLSGKSAEVLNRSMLNNLDQSAAMIDGWLMEQATKGVAGRDMLASAVDKGILTDTQLQAARKQSDAFAAVVAGLPPYILEQIFQRSKYKARLYSQLFASISTGFTSPSFDQFSNVAEKANAKIALNTMAQSPELYQAAMVKGGLVKSDNGKIVYNDYMRGRIDEDGKYKFTDFRRMASYLTVGAIATNDMRGVDMLANAIPSNISKRAKVLGFLNYMNGNKVSDDGSVMLGEDKNPIPDENAAINIARKKKADFDDRNAKGRVDQAIKVISVIYGDNDSLLNRIGASITDENAARWLKNSIANYAELSSNKMKSPDVATLEAINTDLGDGTTLPQTIAAISNCSEYKAWQMIVGQGKVRDSDDLVPMLEKGTLTKQQADYLNTGSEDDLQRSVVQRILAQLGAGEDSSKIVDLIEKDIQAPKWAEQILSSSVKTYLLSDRTILERMPNAVVSNMYDRGMFMDVTDIDVFEHPVLKQIYNRIAMESVDKAMANNDIEEVDKIIESAKSKALQDLLRIFVQRQFKTDEFVNRIVNSPSTIEESKKMLSEAGRSMLSPLNLYPDFRYKKNGAIIATIHQVLDEHGQAYDRIAVPLSQEYTNAYAADLIKKIDASQLNMSKEFVEDRLFANQTNNVVGSVLKQVMGAVVAGQKDEKAARVLNAIYMIATGDASGDGTDTKLIREINSSINLKGYASASQINQLCATLGITIKTPDVDLNPRTLFSELIATQAGVAGMSNEMSKKSTWAGIAEATNAALADRNVAEIRNSLMVAKLGPAGPDKKRLPLRTENGDVIREFKPDMTLKEIGNKLKLDDAKMEALKQAIDQEVAPNPQLKDKQIFADQWQRLIVSPDSLNNVLLKVVGKLPESYVDELSNVKKMLSTKDRSLADALTTLCASASQSNFDMTFGSHWPYAVKIGNQSGFEGEFEIQHIVDVDAFKEIANSLPVSKDEKKAMMEAAVFLAVPNDRHKRLSPWARCEILSVMSKTRNDAGKLVKSVEKVLAVREIQNDPLQRYSEGRTQSMPDVGDTINVWKPEDVAKFEELKTKRDANGVNVLTPEELEYIKGPPGPEVQVVVEKGISAGTIAYDWNGRKIAIDEFAGEADKFGGEAYIKPLSENMFASRKPNEHEQKVIDYMINFMNVIYKNLIRSAMLMGTDKIYVNPSWTMGAKASMVSNSKNAPYVDTAIRDIYDLAQQEFNVKRIDKDGKQVEIKEPSLDQYGNTMWSSKRSSAAMKASYDNTAKRWGFTLADLDHHHKTETNWGYSNEIFLNQVWMMDLTGKDKTSQKMLKHLNKRMAKKTIAQISIAGASLAAFIISYFKVMYRDQEFRYNRSGEVVAEAYQAWREDPANSQWLSNPQEMATAKQVASQQIGVDITGIDDPAWKYREIPQEFYERMVSESTANQETDDRPEPAVIAEQLDKILQATMPNMWLHPEYRNLPTAEIPIRVAKDILANAIELFPQKALRDDQEYLNSVLRAVTAFEVSPEKELELLTQNTDEPEAEESVFADETSPAKSLAADAAEYLKTDMVEQMLGDTEMAFGYWVDEAAPELHSDDELRNEVMRILREMGFKLEPESPEQDQPSDAPSVDDLNDMFRTERKASIGLNIGDSVCVERTVSSDIRAASLACKKASGKIAAHVEEGYVLKFDSSYDERVLNRQRWIFEASDLKGNSNVR